MRKAVIGILFLLYSLNSMGEEANVVGITVNSDVVEVSAASLVGMLKDLKSEVSRRSYYPRWAIEDNHEGRVVVGFKMSRAKSRPYEIKIVESSGHRTLDDAAMDTIRSVRVDFIPKSEGDYEFEMTQGILYKLM